MKLVYLVSLFVLVLQHFEGTETTGCTPEKTSFPCNTYKTVSTARYITGVNHRTCYKSISHGCWGSWSPWSDWSDCGNHKPHKCIGQQKKTRIRVCDNPKPSNGGKYCPGPSNMYIIRSCQIADVLKNGGWSAWGNWRQIIPCSRLCGKGVTIVIRQRLCNNPKPRCGGKLCEGTTLEYKEKGCYNKNHRGSKVLQKKASTKKLKIKKN